MKYLSVLMCLPLLAACNTTKIDAAIQRNLPQMCSMASTGHVAFTAVAVTGKIKQSTVVKEQIAWAGIETMCADPENVTAEIALVRVAQAYVIISAAMREAKAVQ